MAFTLLFICAFFAFALSAICGGGAGLMLIPLLSISLPMTQVPAALSIGTFTSSVSRFFVFFSKIRWDVVKWFVPAALPAVWLGVYLLKFLNPVYLELGMAIFLIWNIRSLFRKSDKTSEKKYNSPFVLLLIGSLAGFLSGLTGAVGLLFNRFYLHYGLTKEEIVATRAANELLLHLIKIILYSIFGLIADKSIIIGLTIAAAALFSTWAMKWILPKISELAFKKVGYAAMVFSGFIMFGQSMHTILIQNNGYISFKPMAGGMESKLQWQRANFSLEFEYDEGFEIEQVISIKELSAKQQEYVLSKKGDADDIIIESVHGIGKQQFEAYYYKKHSLIKMIEFD